MYFFGKLSWIVAFFVFLATWQTFGEVVAIGLAAGAWFVVWSVSRTIVDKDRERTGRKKFEKQIEKAIEDYTPQIPSPTPRPDPVPQTNQSKSTERLIAASGTPAHLSGADKQANLPEWSNQLTPNRLEWARNKLAEGLEQGEDRAELEQRLMFQLLEMGWIE